MRKLAKLRESLAQKKAEGLKLLEDIETAEGDDAVALEERYDEIEAEVNRLAGEIQLLEALDERRRRMEAVISVPAAGDRVTDEPDPAATGGFRDLGEFACAVRQAMDPAAGQIDQRLRRMAATPSSPHTGGGSSGEGYMLPPQYRDQIWTLMLESDTWLRRTDLEPTTAREVKIPVDESTPWDTTGVQAYWRAEAGKMTERRQPTEGRSVPIHDVYAFVSATEELLADAPRLAARLSTKAAERLNWKIDDAVHYGTGVGQPKGWFPSGAAVTVAKESGQSADTIVVKNLVKMMSRLITVPGDSPVWMTNRDTMSELMSLTLGDMPVWLPPGGLTGAPNGTIFGYPVIFTEHAKTLGDKGDISLLSMRGYYAARRTSGPQFASSIHLFFDYGAEAFRWTVRIGGQPYLSAPVSPKNGSATRSHFVTLAERT